MQEVNAHKALKKEVARLRKEQDQAAELKESVQRLEKHVASLRSANTSLRAQLDKTNSTTAAASGAISTTDGSADGSANIATLQQKVQLQAVELRSVAKALAEREAELLHAREELQMRVARGAAAGNAPQATAQQVTVCCAPFLDLFMLQGDTCSAAQLLTLSTHIQN